MRQACSARAWSRAVELGRSDAVAAVGAVEAAGTPGEQFRVRVPGRPVALTVVLYPDEAEWECDCGSGEDACEHVAAATIALKRARERGEERPQPSARIARLSYRLRRQGERLALERWLVWPDGREKRLEQSLASLVAAGSASRSEHIALVPSQADLSIDRIVEARRVAALPLDSLVHLLRLLADASDVRLDDRPITASAEPVTPCAVVTGDGAGAALHLSRAPCVTEVVLGGLALCTEPGEPAASASSGRLVLRPLGAVTLTGLWLERLPVERRFEPRQISELLGEVVPSLRAEGIDVHLDSESLARKPKRLPPALEVELTASGDALAAFALIVYGDPPEARVHGDRFVQLGRQPIERDEAGERRLTERLRRELDLSPGRRVQYVGAEAHEAAQRLRAWRGAVTGHEHLERYPVAPLRAHVAVRAAPGPCERDEADLCLEVSFDVEPAEPTRDGAPRCCADAAAVIAAWQQGQRLVGLEGGGWAPIPADWLAVHGHRLAELLAAREAAGRVPRGAALALAELCRALDHPLPAALGRLGPLVDGFEALPPAELPAGLEAELRPYQRQGIDWLGFLRRAGLGAILADDMGLGKTLQALAAISGRTLVVAPTSVVHNWAQEIRRFRPSLRVSLYHGPSRELDPRADVTLTSYALLRLDTERLERESWDTVIVDEAQAIKNPESQVAQAAFRLRAAFRVALTGTPVENRLDELWSIGHFTNPGLLGGRSDFRDRYAQPIAEARPGAAERLRRRIRPVLLRRTKGEVARDLPPRTEAVMLCELDETERSVYDAVRLATRERVVRELSEGGSVLAALEALLRLRQAACHAALVPGQHAESSAKIARLLAALEELTSSGHRALVFSQWTSLLDLLEPHLRATAIDFVRLDGSTRDREGVVGRFQAADGPPVMLLSLKAGGTGLNLTAADHVFLLDPWWNPAVEDQAADRSHRIGQDRPVMVYRLVAKDTVEERILALQLQKRAVANAALADAAGAVSIGREDLLALLE